MELRTILDKDNVLNYLPVHRPYRFVDAIQYLDLSRIIASYCFREDEFFYEGHFPGNPITPGAILVEAAAQTLLAHGIYIVNQKLDHIGQDFLLVESEIKFRKIVKPGETIVIQADKIFFKHHKLKSKVSIQLATGGLVCRGIISGIYHKKTINAE